MDDTQGRSAWLHVNQDSTKGRISALGPVSACTLVAPLPAVMRNDPSALAVAADVPDDTNDKFSWLPPSILQ